MTYGNAAPSGHERENATTEPTAPRRKYHRNWTMNNDQLHRAANGQAIYEEVPYDEIADLTVSSELDNGMHSPALDLDIEAKAIPSSTPGHWHLWFDGVEMSWELYKELLDVLARCGILDRAYVDHSIERGHTAVRLPHVPKTANGSSSRARSY